MELIKRNLLLALILWHHVLALVAMSRLALVVLLL